MEFFEAPAFSRHLASYLDDEQYRALQRALAAQPEAGDVIENTGGFRKVRWPDPKRRKGKRGGLRLIYYFFPDQHQIWLMTVYGKDEKDDLSDDEKRALRLAIERELEARHAGRTRRPRR